VKRWTTVLGRGGTTLIAVSLALLLVSVVPQLQFSRNQDYKSFLPKQTDVMFTTQELTPQQELEVTVAVEGTLKVYVLEMSVLFQFFDGGNYVFELSDLQEFLEENPEGVILDELVENGNFSEGYTPTRAMNATLIFFNPSPETTQVEYYVALKSSSDTEEKVQTIAYGATVIGILLALPWVMNLVKQRKQR
jgi:hypothetical protein